MEERRFSCARCGNCCKRGGNLRFTKEDWDNLLKYLNTDYESICQKYEVENIDEKLYFIYCKDVCPFLMKNNECSIQSIKPFFCRNYIPFLDDKSNPVYRYCKGIGTGKEYTQEEIQEINSRMQKQFIIRRN